MRTNDPRLEQNGKEMEERVKKFNALMLAVLKGHLVIEQAMDEFLAISLFHPDQLRGTKFNFNNKAQLCRSMSLGQEKDSLWDVLRAANRLRNQVAHSLDTAKVQTKMDELRKIFLATLTPRQAEDLRSQADDFVAQSACVICAGFLATLKSDAESRRQVLDQYWKPAQ
jgi:hypothetical protein